IMFLFDPAEQDVVTLQNVTRFVQMLEAFTGFDLHTNPVDNLLHQSNIEAEDDDLWMVKSMKQANGISEGRSFFVLQDSDDVPAVFLHVGQQFPVMVIGGSGKGARWRFFLGHVDAVGGGWCIPGRG